MPSKISRYTASGWVEVANLDDLVTLDARLDTIEAGITGQAPAYVGKRPGTATDAWHSRIDGSTVSPTGFAVRTAIGAFVQLDKPATFGIYQSTVAGGGTSNLLASFDAARCHINGMGIGLSPPHGAGYVSLWRNGAEGSGDYAFLANSTDTFINCPNTGTLHLRRNNGDLMTIGTDNILSNVGVIRAAGNTDIGNNSIYFVSYGGGWNMIDGSWVRSTNDKGVWLGGGWYGTNGGITIGRGGAIDGSYKCDVAGNIRCDGTIYGGDNIFATRQVKSSWNDYGSDAWNYAHLLAYPSVNNGQQSRLALHSPGIAPQLRATGSQGEILVGINNQSTGYVNFMGLGYLDVSTIRIKQEVRSLTERDILPTRLDPFIDTVEAPPDIMSLNPVVYRHRIGQLEIVPTDPSGDYATVDVDDPMTFESVPRADIHGSESRRERLGLIAEEVQYVIPSAVVHDIDLEAQGIDYTQVTVALLSHVQRLTDEVATLRYRITELENP